MYDLEETVYLASSHCPFLDSPLVQLNGGGMINENQRLVLVCHADAYPSIDSYQWFRDSQKLNTDAMTSSMVVEKVSKFDDGIYSCQVKNTVKYSNGSAIERINQTQIRVTVQCTILSLPLSLSLLRSLDAPRVSTSTPMIATDVFTSDIPLSCVVDSFPESKIFWKFQDQAIVPSTKYSIAQNKSISQLVIKQISSNADYGSYSCHASNKLGDQSISIQLRSKGIVDMHFRTRGEIERTATAFALFSIIIISDFRRSISDLPVCTGGSFLCP